MGGRGRRRWGVGVHLLDQLHQGFGLELLNPAFVHTRTVVYLGLPFCLTYTGRGVFWNDKGEQFATHPHLHTGWPWASPSWSLGVLSCDKSWDLGLSVQARNRHGGHLTAMGRLEGSSFAEHR